MATLDTRKFLDYNGLETFWNGIKNKFAEQTAVNNLQGEVDGLTEQFNTLNGTITEQLEQILADISQRSPLTSNNYTSACELAQTALMGSVIYVENSDGDYAAGPYIVTANRNLLYINTHEGNVDFDNIDAGALLGEIAGIKEEIASIKNDYATKEELQEAINGIGGTGASFNVQVVSELPVDGELGTIYLKPNNLSVEDNTFTEYIYVQHGGINMYEKIGVGVEDLAKYVQSDEFDEKIAQINEAIANAKNNAITTVQNSIISKDDDSFGNTMSIPADVITALINDN